MENGVFLIFAGGTGTRLWPMSRKKCPKQFLDLMGKGCTMLQDTYARVLPAAEGPECIFVSTTREYKCFVQEQLPGLPEANIIVEPCARDTAAAFTFAIHKIAQRMPNVLITTLPADHAVGEPHAYLQAVHSAMCTAQLFPEKIGMIGLRPTEPSTDLGYIEIGRALNVPGHNQIFEVARFKEKPDLKTAEEFLKRWEYFWNAAYFVFYGETFLEAVHKHAPGILESIQKMDLFPDQADKIYAAIEKTPIDVALMEKLENDDRFMVAANFRWSDVGSWKALYKYVFSDPDRSKNIVHGPVTIDQAHGCYVRVDQQVEVHGVSNVIIVQYEGVTLIISPEHAHKVKEIFTRCVKKTS